MSANNETEETGSSSKYSAKKIRKAFSSLPLGEKVTTLMGIEFDLLTDAAMTVVGAVSKVADEVAEALSNSKSEETEPAAKESTAN